MFLDLNKLLMGLVRYELIDNLSIKKTGIWLNQEEIIDILNLERLYEKVHSPTLEILCSNKESIYLISLAVYLWV